MNGSTKSLQVMILIAAIFLSRASIAVSFNVVGSGEGPVIPVIDAISAVGRGELPVTPVETKQRLVEPFTSLPVLTKEGDEGSGESNSPVISPPVTYPLQFQAGSCSSHVMDWATSIKEALAGYSLSRQQQESIQERCAISDNVQSVFCVVKSDNDLKDSIRILNEFAPQGKEIILIMPGSHYILPGGLRIQGDVNANPVDHNNVTLCGVADLISDGAGSQIRGGAGLSSSGSGSGQQNLVNGEAINIPARKILTHVEGSALYSAWGGNLSLLGLDLDITGLDPRFRAILGSGRCDGYSTDPTLIIAKSYLRTGRQEKAIQLFCMGIDISDSVIESRAKYNIITLFMPANVSVLNSIIIHRDHDHGITDASKAVEVIYTFSQVALPAKTLRVENTKILGEGQSKLHGIAIKIDNWVWQTNLIRRVEFSKGVTIPVKTFYGKPDISAGSTGNTWAEPSGDIATRGCSGLLHSGFIGFEQGIRCDSGEPQVSAPQSGDHRLSSDDGVLPRNSASNLLTGYISVLIPFLMFLY